MRIAVIGAGVRRPGSTQAQSMHGLTPQEAWWIGNSEDTA